MSAVSFSNANKLMRASEFALAHHEYAMLRNLEPSFSMYQESMMHCEKQALKQRADMARTYRKLATPAVSVIIPVCDGQGPIASTLLSIVNQSCGPLEIVIVDALYREEEIGFLQELLNQPLIRYVKAVFWNNSQAYNTGVGLARGKYIVYVKPGMVLGRGWLKTILSDMCLRGICFSSTTVKLASPNIDREILNEAAPVTDKYRAATIVHEAGLLNSLGPFNQELFSCEEVEFQRRAASKIAVHSYEFEPALDFSRPLINDDLYEFALNRLHKPNDLKVIEVRKELSRPKASVIVVDDGTAKDLVSCVAAVSSAEDTGLLELILISQEKLSAPGEDILRALKNRPLRVTAIQHARFRTRAALLNCATAISQADFLIFLDCRYAASPKWASSLIQPLETNPSIAFVQSLVLDDVRHVKHGVYAPPPFSRLPYSLYKGLLHDDLKVVRARNVSLGSLDSLAVRRLDFFQVGRFDPRLVNGLEGFDLGLKLTADASRTGYYAPGSVARMHIGSAERDFDKAVDESSRLLFCMRWEHRTSKIDSAYLLEDSLLPYQYEMEQDSSYSQIVRTAVSSKWMPAMQIAEEDAKLCIAKPSGIGNMLMFLPALTSIREKYPLAHITLLCYESERVVVNGLADEIITVPKNNGKLDLQSLDKILRGRHFDAVLYPPFTGLVDEHECMRQLSAFHLSHPNVMFNYRHEVSHNNDMAEMLGATPSEHYADTASAAKSEHAGAVAIHVGSSTSKAMRKKRWPLQYWTDLVERISKTHQVVFVGGKDDLEDTNAILESLTPAARQNTTMLADRLSFDETRSVIQNASLFLSNDSGIMHLASTTKVPIVAMFGPTNPLKNAPFRKQNCFVLTPVNVACSPCHLKHPSILLKCDHQQCLYSITPEIVYSAASQYLSGSTLGGDDQSNGPDFGPCSQLVSRVGGAAAALCRDEGR